MRPQAAWISLKEIPRYTKVAIWITQTPTYKEDLVLLSERISALVQHNGFNWTFIYLKESFRLVTRYLAGSPDKLCITKIRVRLDSKGLPVIIPFRIRQELSLEFKDVKITRATLTLLSIFRVFKTSVKPDLTSITGSFSGLSSSLEIGSLTRDFTRGFRFRITKIRGFISESAGPNSSKATAGAALDAIALMHNPTQLLAVISVLLKAQSWLYLTSLLSCIILGIPLYLLQLTGISKKGYMGRLSVVYDQAGKARIVALANWWVQLCLYPLHKSVFRFLKTLETDGTFNQHAPIDRLIGLGITNESFSCFDLSSATDRLPVNLQADILNSVESGLGSVWKRLLDIKWHYKGEDIKYAVGQPMGAYSSWAMLALTHHIIVQLASQRAGIRDFSAYAVLGDDIVIQDNDVAAHYLNLMEMLGVKVNPSKSVVSNDLLEFAKRLRTRTHDISPVGPGAILSTARRPIMAGTLFADLDQRDIISTSDAFKAYLSSFPFRVKRIGIVLSIFGIRGHLLSLSQLDVETLSWIAGVELIDQNGFVESLKEHAYSMALAEADKAVVSTQLEESLFYKHFYQLAVGKTVLQDYFGILTLFVSPMFWLYLEQFITASVNAQNHQEELIDLAQTQEFDSVLDLLFKHNLANLSIRWNMKEHRRYTNKVKALSANTLVSMINDYYSSRGIAQKANFSKIHKGL